MRCFVTLAALLGVASVNAFTTSGTLEQYKYYLVRAIFDINLYLQALAPLVALWIPTLTTPPKVTSSPHLDL